MFFDHLWLFFFLAHEPEKKKCSFERIKQRYYTASCYTSGLNKRNENLIKDHYPQGWSSTGLVHDHYDPLREKCVNVELTDTSEQEEVKVPP